MTRQQIYALLILISAAIMFGRIMAVDRIDYKELQNYKSRINKLKFDEKDALWKKRMEQNDNMPPERYRELIDQLRQSLHADALYETPILSGNDRSRWATIRAIVEPDMRVKVKDKDGKETDRIVWYAIDKVQSEKGFDTIDMVKHGLPDDPDVAYLYSSKPPLLPTLMAIPYAVIYYGSQLIGEDKNHLADAGANVITNRGKPISLADSEERYFIVRVTLVLVNLIPIVFCWVLLAKLIDRFGTNEWSQIFCVAFVCFGTFLSTFIVTLNNHIPAMICVTLSGYAAVKIFFDGDVRLRNFAVAGFFGMFAFACDLPAISFGAAIGLLLLRKFPRQTILGFVPAAVIVVAGFLVTNYIAHKDFRPAYGNKEWYFFEYRRNINNEKCPIVKSYWHNPQGVDIGEESRLVYLLHTTVGHHGLFSLTPVWVLSFVGIFFWVFRWGDPKLQVAGLLILAISAVVISFYLLFMGQNQRSYGGMSSALRWLFWLAPLWVVPLVTVTDKLAKYRSGRGICLTLLMLSIFSASYPIWNPWTHPWIYQLMLYLNIPVLS
jgi:hypothetical protein